MEFMDAVHVQVAALEAQLQQQATALEEAQQKLAAAEEQVKQGPAETKQLQQEVEQLRSEAQVRAAKNCYAGFWGLFVGFCGTGAFALCVRPHSSA